MEPHYPIRTAARLTSLSVDTLRAWERRYQAVTPERTNRGRLYTKDNIAKLILLRRLVEQGYTIGQIAPLGPADLQDLLAPAPISEPTSSAANLQICQLAQWFADFDDIRANAELNRLAILTPPRDFVMQTLFPLMREVGERWHKGEIGIAEEHLVSASMRLLLGSLIRLHPPRPDSPRMLLATLSGDQHDFGIIAAAMIAATLGWSPLLLGPNLPVGEVARAVARTRPAAVVIGNSGRKLEAPALCELAELVPPAVAIWLGGPLPDQSKSMLPTSIVLAGTMETFEKLCVEALPWSRKV